MTGQPTTQVHDIDVLGLLLGQRVKISMQVGYALLHQYHLRSASRRGYVIIVGNRLVRIGDEPSFWTLELLPWPAHIADEEGHEHRLAPYRMSDGWDVLCCATCGTEW
jgi:hypothetical protein